MMLDKTKQVAGQTDLMALRQSDQQRLSFEANLMCAKSCRFAASCCVVRGFRSADTVCSRLNNHVDAKTAFYPTTIDETLSSAAKSSAYATLDSLYPGRDQSIEFCLGTTSAIHHETGDEDG